jgi:hypothetical protein
MTAARSSAPIAAALAILIQGALAAPVLAEGYPQTVDARSFYQSQSSVDTQSYQSHQSQTSGDAWTRETRVVDERARPVVRRLTRACGCRPVRPARHVRAYARAKTETQTRVWTEREVAPPPPPALPPPPSDEVGYIPASFFADEGGVGPFPVDYGYGGGGGYAYAEGGASAGAHASASVEASVAISAYARARGRGGRPGGGGHGCGCK